MGDVLLQAIDLKKYFSTPRGELHAVDNVNFSIRKGETLGVVGESGCGKSTLGRTILRLLPITGGQVLYDGQDVAKMSKSQMIQMRKRMQIIFQDPYSSLDPRMSVAAAIAEPLKIHGVSKNRAELNAKVQELMDTVGIAERYATSYPHELDGGRRQRVVIARSMALNPEFIVCDEPVSALDVSIQAQILNLMMDLQDQMGLTYMFITHDLSVVRHISDHIAVMYLGEMVEKAPVDELFRNPRHPYTVALLAAIPKPNLDQSQDESELIKGEVSSPIEPKPGCRFIPRCPYAKPECAEPQELKDVGNEHFVACWQYS
ncbi:MAG: ABC transporter ATP-binding protein [Ruminococcaceae bacterium]|nr:ABC transporter ATP-binding protein [Oscillospiraceae bacterium]